MRRLVLASLMFKPVRLRQRAKSPAPPKLPYGSWCVGLAAHRALWRSGSRPWMCWINVAWRSFVYMGG